VTHRRRPICQSDLLSWQWHRPWPDFEQCARRLGARFSEQRTPHRPTKPVCPGQRRASRPHGESVFVIMNHSDSPVRTCLRDPRIETPRAASATDHSACVHPGSLKCDTEMTHHRSRNGDPRIDARLSQQPWAIIVSPSTGACWAQPVRLLEARQARSTSAFEERGSEQNPRHITRGGDTRAGISEVPVGDTLTPRSRSAMNRPVPGSSQHHFRARRKSFRVLKRLIASRRSTPPGTRTRNLQIKSLML
jgi:hypothetical protein